MSRDACIVMFCALLFGGVRIVARVTQRAGHPVDELFGDGVLEPLGLGVDLAPVVTELLREIDFENAMTADHLESGVAPLVRQLHAAVGHVLDQAGLRQTFHHATYRWRCDFEHRRDVARGCEPPLTREVLDRFQVVLDRPCQRR